MRRFLPALLILAACRSETGQTPIDEPERPHLALQIDSPEPGAYLPIGPTAVVGRYETLGDLRLGEVPLSYADGTFEGEIDLVRGTNLIEVRGRSPGGTTYATHNAVIAGDLADPAGPVAEAVVARLNRGGLDRLSGLVAELVTAEALEPLLVTGEPLTTWEEGDTRVDVEVTGLSFADVSARITPGDGTAQLRLTLHDLDLGVWLQARRGAGSASLRQRATASRVQLDATLAVRVDRGTIRTSLSEVDVQLVDLRLDTSEWPSWLQGSFTDAVIRIVLEGVLRGVLPDLLPPILDEQLATLDLSFEAMILERSARATATIRSAGFDPDGLQIGADLALVLDGVRPRPVPGYLTSVLVVPTPDRAADLAIALRDDVLNLASLLAWRADLLELMLTTDDESLPPFVFDALGGSRNGSVTISADLPPTIVQADGKLRAQVGELMLRVDTEGGRNGELLIAAAGGHVDLELGVTDGELSIGLSDTTLQLAVRETDWTTSLPEATAQLESLLPLELAFALLTDLAFPLPTLGDLAVEAAVVDRDPGALHTRVAITLGD